MARLSDWHVDEDGRPGSILRECLTAAVAAPSVHNTQPWRFRPCPGGIDVLADYGRLLPAIDPAGRQLLISVGAAVLNLRVAVLAHGRQALVRALPEDATDVIAQIRFGRPIAPSLSVRMLARAIARRRTNRRAFSPMSPPAEVLAEVADAARVEGARLAFAGPASREAILGIARLAAERQAADPGYVAELASWTTWHKDRRDGVPPEAYAPPAIGEALPLRDFAIGGPAARARKTERFEHEPTLGLLYSNGDSTRDWVVAGQALQRALLTATARGAATTMMTQPVEVEDLRDLLRRPGAALVPQAIIRFGYGPPSAAIPRRPIDEVLDTAPTPAPTLTPAPAPAPAMAGRHPVFAAPREPAEAYRG